MKTCGDERALGVKWNIEADKLVISILKKDQPDTQGHVEYSQLSLRSPWVRQSFWDGSKTASARSM